MSANLIIDNKKICAFSLSLTVPKIVKNIAFSQHKLFLVLLCSTITFALIYFHFYCVFRSFHIDCRPDEDESMKIRVECFFWYHNTSFIPFHWFLRHTLCVDRTFLMNSLKVKWWWRKQAACELTMLLLSYCFGKLNEKEELRIH